MAFAGARFADSLLQAKQGKKGIDEPTFVESPIYADQGIEFFATNVELGPEGVEKILPVGETSEYEKDLITKCIADLKKNIEKGKNFVKA